MSGITNKVEHVAGKFLHSGEPGSTGRENFEDTTGLTGSQHQQHSGQHGLGSGLTGGHQSHGLTGDHNNSGLTGNNNTHGLTGNNHSGLTGNNSGLTGNNHGLTGDHNNSGLTGNNHGLTGDHHNNNTSSGLTGNHGSGSTGATSGILGNSKTQDVGSGVPTGGLTGTGAGSHNNHGLSSESTARSDLGQTGSHSHSHSTTTDHNASGKPGLMEKVKDAVGLNKDHNNTTHDNTHSNTHGTHNSGTGSGLNTLSGGQNTTSTGLTGSSGHPHDNHATNNTAAALGAGSIAGDHHDSHSGLGHNSSSQTGTGLGSNTHTGTGLSSNTHTGTGLSSNTHTGTGLGSNTGSHTGAGLGSNTGSHSGLGSDHNRVGDLSQDSSRYERTGASGPTTSGAAGTDRFDTGNHHNTTGTGLTGTTDHGLHEGEGRKEKGTGGLSGLLTTTDKDFLGNRDRVAKDGAYVDTDKYAQQNTSGPGGNSALTGREGTTAANPVAQAQAHGANVGPNAGHQSGLSHGTAGTGVAATHGDVDEHGNPKKKGIVEKIKEAIS